MILLRFWKIEQDNDRKLNDLELLSKKLKELINNETDRIEKENDRLSKQELIKRYIDYIIEKSEEYFGVKFNSLHFTAPVKMKGKFISFFEKCYSDKYDVCDFEHCVDEAVAVIFDYIEKEDLSIQESASSDNGQIRDKKMVVLDCGGGTTDLAACDYHSEKSANGYRTISVHTRAEKGDNGFGGNNITFKIMQLIKIKLCKVMRGEVLDDDIVPDESEVLKSVDDLFDDPNIRKCEILDKVYGKFQRLYSECEQLIPTLFENNELPENDKADVKRNFYFLWQFAEQIKLEFYREDKVVVNKNSQLDLNSIARSSYLYVYDENERLKRIEDPLDNIEITINEIRKIICGDIYLLINKLLPDRDHADDKDYYFLSGQSCKINLFNELLKEFIPGRKLRNKLYRSSNASTDIDLKLKCISGSINYIAANNSGNLGEVRIITDRPAANYYAHFPAENDNEVSMYGLYVLTSQQAELDISIYNSNDNSKRVVTNNVDPRNENLKYNKQEMIQFFKNNSIILFEPEYEEKISEIMQSLEKGSYALRFPSRDGYGFCLLFIECIENGEFIRSEPRYLLFEEETVSFFDGR